jgi:hypothetical protein
VLTGTVTLADGPHAFTLSPDDPKEAHTIIATGPVGDGPPWPQAWVIVGRDVRGYVNSWPAGCTCTGSSNGYKVVCRNYQTGNYYTKCSSCYGCAP